MTADDPGTPANYTTTSVGASAGRERSVIIGLAALIAIGVAVYVGLRSSVSDTGGSGTLLPFQMLVRDVVQADQEIFASLRQSLRDAEVARARAGSWPDATDLPALPSKISDGASYAWTRRQENVIVNYLGLPQGDVSSAAWLIRVAEPDPASPVDTAPNDEEHSRLPDGTVLHVSIWTHRFGSQVANQFFAKPENGGWVQLLTAPLNPIGPPLQIKKPQP